MRTWSPCVSTFEANVSWGRESRSASIAGTTLIEPSVEDIPHITRSYAAPAPSPPAPLSIALASTSEVPIASEPAMASSTTCTPLSAPICNALRTASTACAGPTQSAVTSTSSAFSAFSLICSACSTAYSSSSESSPSTPTRSTVLSSSKCRSPVASGTYFTQTAIFMVATDLLRSWRQLERLGVCWRGYRELAEAWNSGAEVHPLSVMKPVELRARPQLSGADELLGDLAADQPDHGREAPVRA